MAVAYLATPFMPESAMFVVDATERFYACSYIMVMQMVLMTSRVVMKDVKRVQK